MKNKVIYLISSATILILVLFVLFKVNERLQIFTTKKSGDTGLDLYNNNPQYVRAKDMVTSGDYASAQALLKSELAKAKDNEEKASIDLLYKSSLLYSGDIESGARGSVDIYNDTSYPDITRALALSNALQRYKATKDKYILSYLASSLRINARDANEAMYYINKKVLEVYPLGIATGFVVRQDIINLAGKGSSTEMLSKAIRDIEADIVIQGRGVNSKELVPNIILAKANLLNAAEEYGLAKVEDVTREYDRALAKAKEDNSLVTFQYITMGYLNYLGQKKLNSKADYVFGLVKESLSDLTLINSIKGTPGLMSYQGIISYTQTNKEAKDFFQSKLNW